MNIPRFILICSILVSALSVVSCDRGFAPVIVNVTDQPISIMIRFEGIAETVSGVLPEHSELVQRRKGLIMTEISVKMSSGKSIVYSMSELSKARSTRVVQEEFWFIADSGLTLGDENDYRHFKQEINGHKQ